MAIYTSMAILLINENHMLRTIRGFGKLKVVSGSISLRGNTVLETIDGFDVLVRAQPNLVIQNNTILHGIPTFRATAGLSVLSVLSIQGNPKLAVCCGIIAPLEQTNTAANNTILVKSNAIGCSSKQEIFENVANKHRLHTITA